MTTTAKPTGTQNGALPAYPTDPKVQTGGLTKLEYFTALILSGRAVEFGSGRVPTVVKTAIDMAQAALDEIAKRGL